MKSYKLIKKKRIYNNELSYEWIGSELKVDDKIITTSQKINNLIYILLKLICIFFLKIKYMKYKLFKPIIKSGKKGPVTKKTGKSNERKNKRLKIFSSKIFLIISFFIIIS